MASWFKVEEDKLGRAKRALRMTAVDVWGAEVGRITVVRHRYARFSDVQGIEVEKGLRRRGVGAALYKAAAALSCKRFRAPLASSNIRSAMADAFWRKQHAKGRAHCIKPLRHHHKYACERYTLSCPAPENLSGTRKR